MAQDHHIIFDAPDEFGRGGPEKMKVAAPECGWCEDAAEQIIALRKFVQWVADHSNDPAVVQEAKAHGAKP